MTMDAAIAAIADRLKPIGGVRALVLGGSRARGTATPQSDIDIGLYYDPAHGLDLIALQEAAAELDDEHRDNLVTGVGGWGPWINGGGWLKVKQTPVDFIYRDLDRVAQVIGQCRNGELTMDYQPGHPHGFANSIYMAEMALCQVLWDPTGVVGALKQQTSPYPPALQKAVMDKYFWEAGFSLDNAGKGIYKQDLAFIAGCLFRTVACLNQVLFAMNETYLMNEKGASAIADTFPLAPARYSNRVNHSFTLLQTDPEGLKQAAQVLRELIQDTERLMGGFKQS